MSSPAELPRKVRQHDNDIASLYELVEGVDGKIDALTKRVDTGFFELNGKLDAILRQLAGGAAPESPPN